MRTSNEPRLESYCAYRPIADLVIPLLRSLAKLSDADVFRVANDPLHLLIKRDLQILLKRRAREANVGEIVPEYACFAADSASSALFDLYSAAQATTMREEVMLARLANPAPGPP